MRLEQNHGRNASRHARKRLSHGALDPEECVQICVRRLFPTLVLELQR